MSNHDNKRRPFALRLAPALILLAAMLLSSILVLASQRSKANGNVDNPTTAAEWLIRAENQAEAGEHEKAEIACRTALAYQPWHPGAARKLTRLLLRRGDIEALRDWMDDVVLGDARLAERLFELTEFEPFMDDAVLQDLYREAQIQARD